MPSLAQSREPFRLDERNHIERPRLDQLAGEYRVTPLLESFEPH